MKNKSVTLEQVLKLAKQLSPLEKGHCSLTITKN